MDAIRVKTRVVSSYSLLCFFRSEVTDLKKGAIVAVVASFPIAILFALLFRLHIPLVGYIGPFGEGGVYDIGILGLLELVIVAWLYYGLLGGFIILLVLGAIAGKIVSRRFSDSVTLKNKKIILYATIISIIPVFLVSIQDYIIGSC